VPVSISLRWRAWVATTALLAMALPAGAASAARADDPRSERERVRSEQAALAAELDALEATNAEVTGALRDLEANVSDQQALLADATRVAEEAAAHQERARAEEQRAVEEVTSLEQQVRALAVESFMRPPTEDPGVLLSAGSLGDAARRSALLKLRSGRDDDLLDQLRASREDVAVLRDEAERAAARADEERGEVAGRVEQVEEARDQQQAFADSVEQRLDATLAEAASLAALDQQLADQIAADEARIAAQLAAARARAAPAPRATSGTARAVSIGNGSIVSVRGIRVHRSIAEQLEALLSAADADGIALSGAGYRDPSAQIALRRAHCGTSDAAVYDTSPSQCSPPTARPGASMHEKGLAIDFTYNGALIKSRDNDGFRWLDANASRFGLYNLPVEPWHWSTNGN
jgi:LAS superfamily LD-carboxypeptidase LdcB